MCVCGEGEELGVLGVGADKCLCWTLFHLLTFSSCFDKKKEKNHCTDIKVLFFVCFLTNTLMLLGWLVIHSPLILTFKQEWRMPVL